MAELLLGRRPRRRASATTPRSSRSSGESAARRSSTTSSTSPRSRPASWSSSRSPSTCATLVDDVARACSGERAPRQGPRAGVHVSTPTCPPALRRRSRRGCARSRSTWSATPSSSPSAGEVAARRVGREPHDGVALRFAVRDTGIGIPADKLDKLFRPSRRSTRAPRRKFGGTGLGLAICKRLVEIMGGAIRVTSEVGRGSTFWFAIPIPTRTAAADRRAALALDGRCRCASWRCGATLPRASPPTTWPPAATGWSGAIPTKRPADGACPLRSAARRRASVMARRRRAGRAGARLVVALTTMADGSSSARGRRRADAPGLAARGGRLDDSAMLRAAAGRCGAHGGGAVRDGHGHALEGPGCWSRTTAPSTARSPSGCWRGGVSRRRPRTAGSAARARGAEASTSC